MEDGLTTSSLTPDLSRGGCDLETLCDLFVLTADSARRFLASRRPTLRDRARPMWLLTHTHAVYTVRTKLQFVYYYYYICTPKCIDTQWWQASDNSYTEVASHQHIIQGVQKRETKMLFVISLSSQQSSQLGLCLRYCRNMILVN